MTTDSNSEREEMGDSWGESRERMFTFPESDESHQWVSAISTVMMGSGSRFRSKLGQSSMYSNSKYAGLEQNASSHF